MENYTWDSPYNDLEIAREPLHAIGSVMVSWNHLEINTIHFAADLLNMDHRLAIKIIGPLGNRSRQQVIRSWLTEIEIDGDVKDRIDYLLKLFDRNLANRNFIAHGMLVPEVPTYFRATKYHPEIKEVWSDDLSFLSRVGAEIRTAVEYLMELHDHGRVADSIPLPTKPPMPVLLAETLTSYTIERRPLKT